MGGTDVARLGAIPHGCRAHLHVKGPWCQRWARVTAMQFEKRVGISYRQWILVLELLALII